MNEWITDAGLVVSLLGMAALAYKNFKDARSAGLTAGHRSQELTLSGMEKLNQAQAKDLERVNSDLEELRKRFDELSVKFERLQARDAVYRTRELTLIGAMTWKGVEIPTTLPELPPL